MNLSVTSRHIDVSKALVERTEARLEELFSKYFGKAISANVIFDRDGQNFKSRLEAHVGSSIRMNASASHEDAYSALDAAAQNLAKRLRRHKRKLRDHHLTTQKETQREMAQMRVLSHSSGVEAQDNISDADSDDQPLVIAESNASIGIMSVADAVTELDLTDEPAILFMNSKTGRSNMIYRRIDGHIGWVEPQNHH